MANRKRSITVKKQAKMASLDEMLAAAPSIEALIQSVMPDGEVEIDEQTTLKEVLEHDGWLLTAARCVMWDAIKTAYFEGRPLGIDAPVDIIAVALHHLIQEHALEFIDNPNRFRIPSQGEDEESERISRAIGHLDPSPEGNIFSPGFRPDIALGGLEEEEE